MTTGEMLGFTNRFKEIIAAPRYFKDHRLGNLMTDLETSYEIPMFNNVEFNDANPHVIQLYRTVSYERSF